MPIIVAKDNKTKTLQVSHQVTHLGEQPARGPKPPCTPKSGPSEMGHLLTGNSASRSSRSHKIWLRRLAMGSSALLILMPATCVETETSPSRCLGRPSKTQSGFKRMFSGRRPAKTRTGTTGSAQNLKTQCDTGGRGDIGNCSGR